MTIQVHPVPLRNSISFFILPERIYIVHNIDVLRYSRDKILYEKGYIDMENTAYVRIH